MMWIRLISFEYIGCHVVIRQGFSHGHFLLVKKYVKYHRSHVKNSLLLLFLIHFLKVGSVFSYSTEDLMKVLLPVLIGNSQSQ